MGYLTFFQEDSATTKLQLEFSENTERNYLGSSRHFSYFIWERDKYFPAHLNSWTLDPCLVFFLRVYELLVLVINNLVSVNTGCVAGRKSWGNDESDQLLLNQYSANFCFHAFIPHFYLLSPKNLLSLVAPVQLPVSHYYRKLQPSEDSGFALFSVHDYDLL